MTPFHSSHYFFVTLVCVAVLLLTTVVAEDKNEQGAAAANGDNNAEQVAQKDPLKMLLENANQKFQETGAKMRAMLAGDLNQRAQSSDRDDTEQKEGQAKDEQQEQQQPQQQQQQQRNQEKPQNQEQQEKPVEKEPKKFEGLFSGKGGSTLDDLIKQLSSEREKPKNTSTTTSVATTSATGLTTPKPHSNYNLPPPQWTVNQQTHQQQAHQQQTPNEQKQPRMEDEYPFYRGSGPVPLPAPAGYYSNNFEQYEPRHAVPLYGTPIEYPVPKYKEYAAPPSYHAPPNYGPPSHYNHPHPAAPKYRNNFDEFEYFDAPQYLEDFAPRFADDSSEFSEAAPQWGFDSQEQNYRSGSQYEREFEQFSPRFADASAEFNYEQTAARSPFDDENVRSEYYYGADDEYVDAPIPEPFDVPGDVDCNCPFAAQNQNENEKSVQRRHIAFPTLKPINPPKLNLPNLFNGKPLSQFKQKLLKFRQGSVGAVRGNPKSVGGKAPVVKKSPPQMSNFDDDDSPLPDKFFVTREVAAMPKINLPKLFGGSSREV